MRPYFLAVCGALAASPVLGADYSTIDIGDVYYINRFGKNNSIVIVERKLGDPAVKVRDAETGVTSVEKASDLLSETELKREERKNKAMGWGAAGAGMFCLLTKKCTQ